MKKNLTCLIALLLVFLVTPIFAEEAEEQDPYYELRGISDNLSISLGIYMPGFSTITRLDPESGIGTEFNFEELLEMPSSLTTFRLDGHIRLGRYVRLEFGYFDLSRETNIRLTNDIIFGDETFTTNADVDAYFNTSIIKAAVKISFVNNGNTEFGVSIGANIINLDVGMNSVELDIDEAEEQIAPVPLIGAHGSFTLMPGLFLNGSIEMFFLSLDEFDGSAIDFRASINYYPIEKVGIGACYSLFNMDIEIDDDETGMKFEYGYNGLQLYVTFCI